MGSIRVQTAVILLLTQLILVFSNNYARRPQQGYHSRDGNPPSPEFSDNQPQYAEARTPAHDGFRPYNSVGHQNMRFPQQYLRKGKNSIRWTLKLFTLIADEPEQSIFSRFYSLFYTLFLLISLNLIAG